MSLNKNNFLRWEGVFTPKKFTMVSDPVLSVNLYANEELCVCSSLSLIIPNVSNGVDFTSLEIVGIKNYPSLVDISLVSPPSWDSDSQLLTTYRPLDLTITQYIVQFIFTDILGNKSAVTNQLIEVSLVYTTWVQYPVSVGCIIDSLGNQTGYKMWSQLQLINMTTSAPVVPIVLKDNSEGDPDYYPPVQDFSLCAPTGNNLGEYADLIISNNSLIPSDLTHFITITNLFLSSSTGGVGGSPLSLNYPCNIPPGKSARFSIPVSAGGFTYDGGISISYISNADMSLATPVKNWYQNNGGAVTTFGSGVVTTVGPITAGGSFTMGSLGITIFPQ